MSRWQDDFLPCSVVKSESTAGSPTEQTMSEKRRSAKKWKKMTGENMEYLLDEYLLPRSVLGPASNCLNLSRRDASLSVMAGVPDVFWSAMRATKGMMGGRWGRDRCLWRPAPSPAASGGQIMTWDGQKGYFPTNTTYTGILYDAAQDLVDTIKVNCHIEGNVFQYMHDILCLVPEMIYSICSDVWVWFSVCTNFVIYESHPPDLTTWLRGGVGGG